MAALGNDVFAGEFRVTRLGRHLYTVHAWIDRFGSWSRDLAKRLDAGQDVTVDLEIGRRLVQAAAGGPTRAGPRRARGGASRRSTRRRSGRPLADPDAPAPPSASSRSSCRLPLVVLPSIASARASPPGTSCSRARRRRTRARHGTLPRRRSRGCPTSPAMGFDVALPAADPSDRRDASARARTTRRRRQPDDPGSPWAIGGAEGGHTAVHPDARHARRLRRAGRARRASTASRSRSTSPSSARPTTRGSPSIPSGSGTGRTARSSTPRTRRRSTRTSTRSTSSRADWRGAVGRRCATSFAFWIEHGVRIFRVDNPHTKPFAFWEWLIARGQARPSRRDLPRRGVHPARGRCTSWPSSASRQSYTYFTWRNTEARADGVLHRADAAAGARVLPAELLAEHAGHPARAPADTAAAPAFVARLRARGDAVAELRHLRPGVRARASNAPREPGSEEYLDSEKYELRHWDLERAGQPARADRAREPRPPREPGAAAQRRRCASTTSTTTS